MWLSRVWKSLKCIWYSHWWDKFIDFYLFPLSVLNICTLPHPLSNSINPCFKFNYLLRIEMICCPASSRTFELACTLHSDAIKAGTAQNITVRVKLLWYYIMHPPCQGELAFFTSQRIIKSWLGWTSVNSGCAFLTTAPWPEHCTTFQK